MIRCYGSAEAPDHIYSLPGTYEVSLEVATINGCTNVFTSNAVVNSLPNVVAMNDTTVSRGIPFTLNATGASTYIWDPPAGLNNQLAQSPTASIGATTTFTVVGTDANGCESSDEVVVEVIDDFTVIPSNVFTPDGNGINDTWFIDNIVNYNNARVVIFNLWGDIIFESDNYQNEWDGTFNNDLLPAGNYYYVISNPDHDKVYRGTITLLRAR